MESFTSMQIDVNMRFVRFLSYMHTLNTILYIVQAQRVCVCVCAAFTVAVTKKTMTTASSHQYMLMFRKQKKKNFSKHQQQQLNRLHAHIHNRIGEYVARVMRLYYMVKYTQSKCVCVCVCVSSGVAKLYRKIIFNAKTFPGGSTSIMMEMCGMVAIFTQSYDHRCEMHFIWWFNVSLATRPISILYHIKHLAALKILRICLAHNMCVRVCM